MTGNRQIGRPAPATLWMAAFGALIGLAMVAGDALPGYLGGLGSIGIVPAMAQDQRQDAEGSSATKGRPNGKASEGMDSFTELIEERPVSREFLREVEARLQAVRRKEADLERREQALERVQRDIEEKLALLDKKREDLKALTKQIDAAREKELKQAVNMYRAMEAESVARVFLEMDLEFVAAVLKRLDVETAGGIYDAMVEQAQGGTDSEKTRKLKELGEFLVNPAKFRERTEAQPGTSP